MEYVERKPSTTSGALIALALLCVGVLTVPPQ